MKKAVITGSTKGIGKAIGKKLLKEGWFVFFNYAGDEKGRKNLECELENEHQQNYQIIKNDFMDESKIEDFVDRVIEKSGGNIDALVCNAGITDRTPYFQMSVQQWEQVLYTNLTVPAFLIQKFGQKMERGAILCIGSILGEYAHSFSVPYGVSKAGLHFLVSSLVKEFDEKDVTINGIITGFTDTDWQKKKPKEARDRIIAKIAKKRFAEPDEIARLSYELLTNKYMTGSLVKIDGGYCYK